MTQPPIKTRWIAQAIALKIIKTHVPQQLASTKIICCWSPLACNIERILNAKHVRESGCIEYSIGFSGQYGSIATKPSNRRSYSCFRSYEKTPLLIKCQTMGCRSLTCSISWIPWCFSKGIGDFSKLSSGCVNLILEHCINTWFIDINKLLTITIGTTILLQHLNSFVMKGASYCVKHPDRISLCYNWIYKVID